MADKGWRRPDAPLVVEGRLYVNALHGQVSVFDADGTPVELDEALRRWLCASWVSGLMGKDSPRVRLTVECLEPETYA